jgi:hypothetical protein
MKTFIASDIHHILGNLYFLGLYQKKRNQKSKKTEYYYHIFSQYQENELVIKINKEINLPYFQKCELVDMVTNFKVTMSCNMLKLYGTIEAIDIISIDVIHNQHEKFKKFPYYSKEDLELYLSKDYPIDEKILHYIAGRLNCGTKISILELSLDIYRLFDLKDTKGLTKIGRPKIYYNICLLCINLSKAGNAKVIQCNNPKKDYIFIGNIDI